MSDLGRYIRFQANPNCSRKVILDIGAHNPIPPPATTERMPEQQREPYLPGFTRWNQTRPLDEDEDTAPLCGNRYDAKTDDVVDELFGSRCDANNEWKDLRPQPNWRSNVSKIVRERRLPILLLLCLVVPVVVVVQNATESNKSVISRPAFYFIGDSITELGSTLSTGGWVTLMQGQYAQSDDMINRGLSGWNTRWFIERALPGYIAELTSGQVSPVLITVWFGANDAVLPDNDLYSQHVPEDEYGSNLVAIVNRLRAAAPKAKIIMITPPAVDEAARLAHSPNGKLERSNEATGRYAKICVEVAQTEGTFVIDMFTLLSTFQGTDFSSRFVDGLHFSPSGNRLFYDQLQQKIIQIL